MGVKGAHSCSSSCTCQRFARMNTSDYPVISPEAVQELDPEVVKHSVKTMDHMTWLDSSVDEDGVFSVGCVVCSQMLAECDKDVIARYGIRCLTGFKPKRFQQHQRSPAHLAAVKRLLQPSVEIVGQPLSKQAAAPSEVEFQAILHHIRKGGSLREGIPGIAHFTKAKTMVFLLAESLKRLYRGWLRSCCTINLLRDERHARLLVRFRCANLRGERGIGVMGQERIVQSTATKITETTLSIFKNFCTQNLGAPGLKDESAVWFDEELFEHIRSSVHALTVDSAGNEVASGENMMSSRSMTAIRGEPCAPNLHTIIRDKAHASRRILQRPWACNEYLSMIGTSLLSASSSFAQLLQHSTDYQAWYQECSRRSSHRAVTTTFGHLRAAKHRFESMASPLSRLCLDWEACIGLLVRLSQERASEAAGAYAIATLEALDEELVLQCALLADACDETTALIRFFDSAEVDNARIAQEVKRFRNRLTKLFEGQHIWSAEGYTKQTLAFLETAHHFLVRGRVKSVGGPSAVTRNLKSKVLQRMLQWSTLAMDVLAAEHPDFELVSSFSCFDLEQLARLLPECRHGFPAALTEPLRRLASTFQLDESKLLSEFADHGAVAAHRWKETGGCNLNAWQYALQVTSSTAARVRHPAEQLEQVLAEYAAMTSSDSIIERDFSKVKHLLSEQQLHATAGVESDSIMLAVADPGHDRLVLKQARELWSELYPPCRQRIRERFDKNVKRPGAQKQAQTDDAAGCTETEFKRRRRQQQLEGPAQPGTIVPTEPWDVSEAHMNERNFNAEKRQKRLFEALRSGTVSAAEVPVEMLEAAVEHFSKAQKTMVARERAEQRMKAAVQRKCPDPADLEGLPTWVTDDLRTEQLDEALERRAWGVTYSLAEAKVLILQDVTDVPDEYAIAAALNGAWVVTPQMAILNQGTCLKLHAGVRTQRSIFMTDAFRETHGDVASLLEALACRTLRILESIGDFAVAKQRATNRGSPAQVLALIVESDAGIFTEVPHCFFLQQFREFIWRLDLANSCPGL